MGPATRRVIGKVLEQRVIREQSYNSCLGILRLADKYSPQRLEAACQRASAASRVNYTMMRNILERGLDKVPDPMAQMLLPEHENIRGAQAYTPS
jgi:hypothetical protein